MLCSARGVKGVMAGLQRTEPTAKTSQETVIWIKVCWQRLYTPLNYSSAAVHLASIHEVFPGKSLFYLMCLPTCMYIHTSMYINTDVYKRVYRFLLSPAV